MLGHLTNLKKKYWKWILTIKNFFSNSTNNLTEIYTNRDKYLIYCLIKFNTKLIKKRKISIKISSEKLETWRIFKLY